MNRNVKYMAVATIVLALAAGVSRLVTASTELSAIIFWLALVAALILAFLAMRLGSAPTDDVEIKTDERGNTVANFKKKNVVAIIPPQPGRTTPRPTNAPTEDLTRLHAKYPAQLPDDFSPDRIVMNLVFVDPDQPELVRGEFEPAVTLQVKFTDEELARARNAARDALTSDELKAGGPTEAQVLARLQLGYWDGSHWVEFSKDDPNRRKDLVVKGHDPYTIKDGVATVRISAWADRQIGAGP